MVVISEGDVTGICWTEARGATTQTTMQRAVFQNRSYLTPKSIVQKRNSPDLAKSHQSLCSKPPDVVPLFIKISYTLKMDHGAPHDLVSMKLYIFILFHSLPSILDTLSSEVFRVSAPNDSIPYSLIFQPPVSFLHGKPRYVILYLCFLLFQTISN